MSTLDNKEPELLQQPILEPEQAMTPQKQVEADGGEQVPVPTVAKAEEVIEEKPEVEEPPPRKAEIGKLTKHNLDQKFNKQTAPKFDENDIETESILVPDQSMLSPKGQGGFDLAENAEKALQEQKKEQVEKDESRAPSSRAAGEAGTANTNTIKSKSITHSQLGGQESENVRRLQEALQSKKEVNHELNQKLVNMQTDLALSSKKLQYVQEESNSLREELRRLKKENRQLQEQAMERTQQANLRDQGVLKKVKEQEEVITKLTVEIEGLKQERDSYKERFQRSLRDSQASREQLERSVASSSTQQILANIRNFGSLSTSHGFAVQNAEGGSGMHVHSQQLNAASNQQEINLQKEIQELRNKYEKQLREHRHQLVQRTRDLQKLERKNVKYRENNRLLTEAVQSLESRNISSIAGSGGANQELLLYEHVLRETNEDLIENMDYMDDEDINLQFSGHNPAGEDTIPGRSLGEPQFDGHNGLQNEGAGTGLYNPSSELNEHGQGRRGGGMGGSGYFENAQDEATGGEGYSSHLFEEEKTPQYQPNQQFQDAPENLIDQQSSSLAQENINLANGHENEHQVHLQNNYQSNEQEAMGTNDASSKEVVFQGSNRQASWSHNDRPESGGNGASGIVTRVQVSAQTLGTASAVQQVTGEQEKGLLAHEQSTEVMGQNAFADVP